MQIPEQNPILQVVFSVDCVSEADKRPSQIPQELLSGPEVCPHSDLVFTSVPPRKTGKK